MIRDMHPKLAAIVAQYPDEEFLCADGFDAALIDAVGEPGEMKLRYSVSKILEILVAEYDDDPEAEPEDPDYDHYTMAREHFDFNIGGAYVGPRTPIYVEDEFVEECDGEEDEEAETPESALVTSKEV